MVSPSVILNFFYSQFFVTPKYPTTSHEGKTVIVTGANIGLGYEAAKHFVRLGAAKVILAVRSPEKGEEARKTIETSEKRSGVVEVWALDLASYDSVKAFAKRVAGLERVDVVVENAGINTRNFRISEKDESSITTNVVSTFLLAFLLLPILKRSAEKHSTTPRLVIVSSEVHMFTSFPERTSASIFATLSDPKTARMSDRYNVSKLLEVFTIRELCQKHIPQPYPVIVNCLNPGLCRSTLTREMDSPLVHIVHKVLARTTEVGSRTLLAAAVAGKESHGQYMSDGVVGKPSALVRSPEGAKVQAKVWKELCEKLEAIQPGVTKDL